MLSSTFDPGRPTPMQNVVDPPSWGQGDVALLMRTRDWAASPLGAPETWPQSLCSTVGLMLNSAFPMFVAWGSELGLLYNDAYAEILGDKHPSALGQRFEVTWSEIWDDIYPIVQQAMAGERVYFENLPLTLHRKGFPEQTWFTFSYSPVHDEAGAVAGMYCVCTETTQQMLAEHHRLDENERLRQLFQQAPGIMAVLRGPKHTFELTNEAYLQLIGHRDVIGKSLEEALPELEGQGFYELIGGVYTKGEPFVGRGVPVKLQRQQGLDLEERFVDFVYQPIFNPAGEVTGIFVEGNDVTEAVRTTQALRESEKRLRQLANTIPNLAWIAEPDGYICWYNDRWYEYTGTTPEEMQGVGWQKVHHPQNLPGVLKTWQHCLAQGEPFEMPFPLRSANGEYRMFFTRVAPLRDESGSIVQWFGTNTDIHDIEKAQEELRSASRRKDEFLAMLAHELRNPLAPISTAAQLLKLTSLDPERVRKTSAVISRHVAHMTELVDDLLDVSRVTRGLVTLQREPVDLTGVLADAIEQVNPLIEQKRQQLTLQVSDEAVFVDGDKTRLTQIFSNILNNAAKYTQEQGRIALRLHSSTDNVEVSVQDNGVGIDARLLPYVFELFTQGERSSDRAQGGLGLGLALVKSLVKLHGGTVAADSQGASTGSRFVVKLPRLSKSAGAKFTEKTTVEDITPPPDLSVLVVDDNVDAAQTLAMLLEIHGYKVLTEYTATAALKRVAEQAPQVMILDIGLPDMDGYELAQRIRALPGANQSTLVALSGYGPGSEAQSSTPPVFSRHLVKPVDTQTLLDVLTDLDKAD